MDEQDVLAEDEQKRSDETDENPEVDSRVEVLGDHKFLGLVCNFAH